MLWSSRVAVTPATMDTIVEVMNDMLIDMVSLLECKSVSLCQSTGEFRNLLKHQLGIAILLPPPETWFQASRIQHSNPP